MYSVYNDLKTAGLRATPQRVAILMLLRQSGEHLSVDQVHRLVSRQHPSITLATVYKILEVFREHGIIQVVAVSPRHVGYCGNPARHAHLSCYKCGATLQVKWPDQGPWDKAQRLAGESGYELAGVQMIFFGCCPRCKDPGLSKQPASGSSL
jgi:Fur family transcriptional regulator, peroxide stress response regulator